MWQNATYSHLRTTFMLLSQLGSGIPALVVQVIDARDADPIARRLRDLGFVDGEPVRVIARGPVGGEPLAVQVGFTRFALRLAEAARIRVAPGHAPPEHFTPAQEVSLRAGSKPVEPRQPVPEQVTA